ncbi:hypothetical protein TNCV_3957791 [Trichonephila clavipes]|nr:hypothetical protein TNCV_3957791 [Trichonephila clavipes]
MSCGILGFHGTQFEDHWCRGTKFLDDSSPPIYMVGQFGELLRSVAPARISSQSSRYCWRSPLPHASALIQRDFGCVLGVQQIKQLPNVAKVDLVWQLGCNLGQSLSNHELQMHYT